MRRSERDTAALAARRRLELLEAELAGIRSGVGTAEPGSWDVRTPASGAERPIAAGPPAGLAPARDVLYAARGRPLPDAPAVVRAPGRHAVPRRGGGASEWVEERMPGPLRGRVRLSSHHLTLLAVGLTVALLVSGWLAVHRGRTATVPAARFTGAVAATKQPAAGESAAAPSASAAGGSAARPAAVPSGSVVVDVAGKVRRPGVVTLPTGSRVQDAIGRAGGIRPGVASGSLNLARVLVDGEQILVGLPMASGTAAAAAGAATPTAGGLVNLNSASVTDLEDLPGVGPVTAQKIAEYRTAHGAFTSVDQLLEVDGIGDKTLADIAPHATL